jgi:hypothetical protein
MFMLETILPSFSPLRRWCRGYLNIESGFEPGLESGFEPGLEPGLELGLEPGLDSGLEPKMTSSDFDG